MPGCEALNASATCCSTATWSGASPVPRQQYQRIRTSPGLAAEPAAGIAVRAGVGAADADSSAPADDDGAAEVEAPGAAGVADGVAALEQAPATMARTATRTPR